MNHRTLLASALACAALALPALAAATTDEGPSSTRQYEADLGFRPEPNGFKFENYGESQNDLDVLAMQRYYGRAVCATGEGASCVLHPQAQAWMEEQNKSMQGGHCMGFSAGSLLFFSGREKLADYGGSRTFALERTQKIERFIAYTWSFQSLDSINQRRIEGAPSEILDALAKSFRSRDELYTVAIFKPDMSGGHAVTPFAIEKRADGKHAVLVYDNNWPNQTRTMIVDRTANTWEYEAATNPREQSDLYKGDASTKTLMLLPTFPGLGTQQCNICGAAEAPGFGAATLTYDRFMLTGDPLNLPRLLIRDAAGRRLGVVGKKVIRGIPGSRVVATALGVNVWQRQQEPQYWVPTGRALRVTIDGTRLKKPTVARLTMVTKGRMVQVRRIRVVPRQKLTISVTSGGRQFSYTQGRAGIPPVLRTGAQGLKEDHTFTITPRRLKVGARVTLTLNMRDGSFKVEAPNAGFVYDLVMEEIDEDGRSTYSEKGKSVDADEQTEFEFEDWEEGDELPDATSDDDSERDFEPGDDTDDTGEEGIPDEDEGDEDEEDDEGDEEGDD